ncbi:hypothetical protein M0805_006826 [Coniferiporia weirii]|nr:hypothetical protein M0805_006826 [Coniferiporia weirii]
MSSFLPLRASPQASPRRRPRGGVPNLSSVDITTSSATSSTSAALSGLSPKDVQLIDEIIKRSPSTATTFLTVFKAYNEVLHERNMDAANDVVYYKILLKLGVVKGHDWGSKWRAVKAQLGYGYGGDDDDDDEDEKEETPTPRSARPAGRSARAGVRVDFPEPRSRLPALTHQRVDIPRRPFSRAPLSTYGRDSVTVHSHRGDETEGTETETQTEATDDQDVTDNAESSSSPTTLIPREKASDSKENALHLSTEASSYPPLPTIDQFLPVQAKKLQSDYNAILEFGRPRTRTSTPPPLRQSPLVRKFAPPVRPTTPVQIARALPSRAINKPVPTQENSFNDEDTWKRVRMSRDEREADRFREVLLLERCWQVWKGSLQWLLTRGEKVEVERGRALLHLHLQKWGARLEEKRKEYHRIGRKHEAHLLRNSLVTWMKRLKAKQLSQWKDDMRRKMTFIRTKRDNRIKEAAWIKWKQLHQGEAADMHFERKLVWNMFNKWKTGLAQIEHLEVAADELAQVLEQNQGVRMWDFWKQQTGLRATERLIRNRVDARLRNTTIGIWKKKMFENYKADTFHDKAIVRNFFHAWKRSVSKLRALERKACKYQNRQDSVLLRAVLHVWTTRERGMLMDRTVKSRYQHSAWMAWKSRLSAVRAAEEHATEFRNYPSPALANAAFSHWRQILLTHQNLYNQAARYDEDLLKHRVLLVWRVQLRVKLKMVKHAKVARKYLLTRQAWNKWRDKLEEKKRLQRLHNLELQILQKRFEIWRSRTARQRYHQLALQRTEATTSTRILSNVLSVWTNRVIALRLRELEVVERRDLNTISLCYDKWKAIFKRHGDDLGLMQSYQLVRQEEIMRRMFARWLSVAKAIRHRRLLLQEREEDMKLAIVEKTWDQWRERFRAERLRPMEYSFNIQLQRNRLYQAYLIWYSKTKSVPAINFFASRARVKFWRIWREAMPKALQAREARKCDRKKLLARALDKWAQAHRTKIALKAVARARYLRLPSGAPRQSLPLSSALSGILRSSNSATSGKTTRPVSPSVGDQSVRGTTVHEGDLESEAGSSGPARRRTFVTRSIKPLTPRLVHMQETGAPKEKTDLWRELRRAQRKPPSERL